jgi:cytochrome c biogenesis protein CcmG/thiol:disulfide interchange protein DsbE
MNSIKMNKSIKHWLPLLLFLVLVGFFAIGLNLNPREISSPLIDKPAPQFSSTLISDDKVHFSVNDMRGKVWLLNVWASWCSACRDEHHLLMEVSGTLNIPIIGLDYKDTKRDAMATLSRFGDPYRAVVNDADGKIGMDYGVYGVPETYLIDKRGIVRYKEIGALSRKSFEEKILPLAKRLNDE